MLVTNEKKNEIMDKLSKEDDFRTISLTTDRTLKINSASGTMLIENYVVIYNDSVYAGNGFARFPDTDEETCKAIGCFTGKKLLIFKDDGGAEYITLKKPASNNARFALVAILKDGAMMFYLNGDLSKDFYKELYQQAEIPFALVQELTSSWMPDKAEELKDFLRGDRL